MSYLSPKAGLFALRILISAQLVIHGSYRAITGGAVGFGGFLTEQGIPFGVPIAWAITIAEILGGLTLMAGKFIRPLVGWFVIELVLGIVLVHSREGWFVVGGGRNGMEYSVVLIGGLAIVGLTSEGWAGARAEER